MFRCLHTFAILIFIIAIYLYDIKATIEKQQSIATFDSANKKKLRPRNEQRAKASILRCDDNLGEILGSNVNLLMKVIQCCDHLKKCDDYIPAKSTKYGVQNNEDRNILPCLCDFGFKTCLRRSHASTKRRVFLKLAKWYFQNKPKCLLKTTRPFCNGYYYNNNNQSFERNDEEKYFCPVLFTQSDF